MLGHVLVWGYKITNKEAPILSMWLDLDFILFSELAELIIFFIIE